MIRITLAGASNERTLSRVARLLAGDLASCGKSDASTLVVLADEPPRTDELDALRPGPTAELRVHVAHASGPQDDVTSALRGDLGDADALVVLGADVERLLGVLDGAASDVRSRVTEAGLPYAGLGAGATVAGTWAVIPGTTLLALPAAPPTGPHDPGEIGVRRGLALEPGAVDVGGVADGALGRALLLVEFQVVDSVVSIDPDAVYADRGDGAQVSGSGAAWFVSSDGRPGAALVLEPIRMVE